MLYYDVPQVPQSQLNKRKAIHTRMFRVFILSGLLLCSFMFGAYMNVFANTEAEHPQSQIQLVNDIALDQPTQQDVVRTVDVQPGDTLWDIAVTHAPNNIKVRIYIEEIKLLNNLDNYTIYAGQLLYLP